eukprot:6103552-Amphidinium_carterae.1
MLRLEGGALLRRKRALQQALLLQGISFGVSQFLQCLALNKLTLDITLLQTALVALREGVYVLQVGRKFASLEGHFALRTVSYPMQYEDKT